MLKNNSRVFFFNTEVKTGRSLRKTEFLTDFGLKFMRLVVVTLAPECRAQTSDFSKRLPKASVQSLGT